MRTKINDLIREQEATHKDIPLFKPTINGIKRDLTNLKRKAL